MHLQAIINQLEKALESDKADELRMRVEVLLEFLKDIPAPTPAPTPAPAPNLSPIPRPTSATPVPTDNKAQVNKVTNLVNYTRPKGT